MTTVLDQSPLEQAIAQRARRRGLTGSLAGMRYANGHLFGGGARKALYVGVGHGLDALLALSDGEVDKAVGVDPFIAEHGNDEDDYGTLKRLIRELGFTRHFVLHRGTIEDYRPQEGDAADLVVINDVLHHIFETQESLRRSSLYPEAVALFQRLREITVPSAQLVIGDVSRFGLRPLLGRVGLHQSYIDWDTKQNWREWDAAAREGGWRRQSLVNYAPYRFRAWRPLLAGPLPRYTLCSKYYIRYVKECSFIPAA